MFSWQRVTLLERTTRAEMTRVVLASASTGRRKVLRQAGIDPLVIVSGVDEDSVVAAFADPAPSREMSRPRWPPPRPAPSPWLDPVVAADCVVIGCDSMLYRDGQLLASPNRRPRRAGLAGDGAAVRRAVHRPLRDSLARQPDRAIEPPTPPSPQCTSAFRHLTICAAYVAPGEPTAVAGGFTLDGLGGWFVDGGHGDPSAVIGIGLP